MTRSKTAVNREFKEMAGDVVISSVVHRIHCSGRLTVPSLKTATS
mgnify:FL=1